MELIKRYKIMNGDFRKQLYLQKALADIGGFGKQRFQEAVADIGGFGKKNLNEGLVDIGGFGKTVSSGVCGKYWRL